MTQQGDAPDTLAKTAFWLTVGGTVLFVGAVFLFVL
jgi:hypothetical protein